MFCRPRGNGGLPPGQEGNKGLQGLGSQPRGRLCFSFTFVGDVWEQLRFVKVTEETGPEKGEVLCNSRVNAGVSHRGCCPEPGKLAPRCLCRAQSLGLLWSLRDRPQLPQVGTPPRPPLRSLVTGFVAAATVARRGERSQGVEETEPSGVRGPPVKQRWQTWGSGRTRSCRHALLLWGPRTRPKGPVQSAASGLGPDRPKQDVLWGTRRWTQNRAAGCGLGVGPPGLGAQHPSDAPTRWVALCRRLPSFTSTARCALGEPQDSVHAKCPELGLARCPGCRRLTAAPATPGPSGSGPAPPLPCVL